MGAPPLLRRAGAGCEAGGFQAYQIDFSACWDHLQAAAKPQVAACEQAGAGAALPLPLPVPAAFL